VLAGVKVPPDFVYSRPNTDTEVLFVHRKLENSDLYYVDNRNDRVEQVDATFRLEGKAPELWHADTGMMEPAAYRIANGSTTVPLRLDPYETVFVVFRKTASSPSLDLPARSESAVATVEGAWELSFEPGATAPTRALNIFPDTAPIQRP
jgi:hypothetical protein